jgi:Ca-activated chloride channel family protein
MSSCSPILLVARAAAAGAGNHLAGWFRNAEQEAMQSVPRRRLRSAAAGLHDAYRRGVALYRAGQFRAAEVAFDRGRARIGALTARYNLGNARFKQGDYTGAIDAYEQVLAEQPDHADAHFNLTLARPCSPSWNSRPSSRQEQQSDQQQDSDQQQPSDQGQPAEEQQGEQQQSGDDEQQSQDGGDADTEQTGSSGDDSEGRGGEQSEDNDADGSERESPDSAGQDSGEEAAAGGEREALDDADGETDPDRDTERKADQGTEETRDREGATESDDEDRLTPAGGGEEENDRGQQSGAESDQEAGDDQDGTADDAGAGPDPSSGETPDQAEQQAAEPASDDTRAERPGERPNRNRPDDEAPPDTHDASGDREAVERFDQLGDRSGERPFFGLDPDTGLSESPALGGERVLGPGMAIMEQRLEQVEGDPSMLLRNQFILNDMRQSPQGGGPVQESRPW